MKTFETEKGNIPDGATHYMNESVVHRFSWGKYVGDDLHLRLPTDKAWVCVVDKFFSGVMELIPQPEKVEWVNGDECEIEMQEGVRRYLFGCECPNNQQTCIVFTKDGGGHMVMPIERLSKPETKQQREDRERLENGKALYELVQKIWCDVDGSYTAHPYESGMVDDNVKEMYARLAIETNYHKGV